MLPGRAAAAFEVRDVAPDCAAPACFSARAALRAADADGGALLRADDLVVRASVAAGTLELGAMDLRVPEVIEDADAGLRELGLAARAAEDGRFSFVFISRDSSKLPRSVAFAAEAGAADAGRFTADLAGTDDVLFCFKLLPTKEVLFSRSPELPNLFVRGVPNVFEMETASESLVPMLLVLSRAPCFVHGYKRLKQC